MFTIENDFVSATINAKGAELNSLIHKHKGLQYMWGGDDAYWGKFSPILFPIVGTLKNNTYFFKQQAYQLTRHGFARDAMFEVTAQSAAQITFTLIANENTLQVYPFHFKFDITYTVQKNTLQVTYAVQNIGEEDMYFSVGAHPAFALPLEAGLAYEDYFLEFDKVEKAGRWLISADGLIETTSSPLLNNTNVLPLTKELFFKDAIVLKQLQSTAVTLKSNQSTHGLRFSFPGFPYLGIWAAKNANFVCIEPWCGIADSVDANQQLTDKEGIEKLAPSNNFEASWLVALF